VRIVARIVLGDVPLARNDGWLRDVDALMDFPGRPMLEQQWKIPLPGTPWGRFVTARRRVDRALYAEIARREGDADLGGDDVLSMLMRAGRDQAAPLSPTELRDQSLSLISAGFDTTSSALSWAVAMGFEHPDRLEAVREELAPLDAVTAQRAPVLDAFVKETLRLRPPAAAALRRTLRPVEIAGRHVPEGQRVALSILRTHLDPGVFADPERFDPDRFTGATPDPFAYLPFGYGARHCVGAGTATALIKAGLSWLLSGYELAPARPGPYRPVGMTLQPEGGLPLRLRRRRGRSGERVVAEPGGA
jgi:cytochrome P450